MMWWKHVSLHVKCWNKLYFCTSQDTKVCVLAASHLPVVVFSKILYNPTWTIKDLLKYIISLICKFLRQSALFSTSILVHGLSSQTRLIVVMPCELCIYSFFILFIIFIYFISFELIGKVMFAFYYKGNIFAKILHYSTVPFSDKCFNLSIIRGLWYVS